MNIQKFTQKSIEAVNQCEQLAYEYGNQQIEQEHLLYSLLTIEDSLILKLVQKMGIDPQAFLQASERALAGVTKVSGSGSRVYVSGDLNKRFRLESICQRGPQQGPDRRGERS